MDTTTLTLLATFAVSLSHEGPVMGFVIAGFIGSSRNIYYHAICLLLMSMIVNYALKITFQIPLSPLLNKEGFAFPSGHMQTVATLYGWIAYKVPEIVGKLLILILLVLIGVSLVYLGYHNYYDIIGAMFCALALIILYITAFKEGKANPLWLILIATMLLIYIYFKLILCPIPAHVWQAYYALVGFISSVRIFNDQNTLTTIIWGLFTVVLCVIFISPLLYVIAYLKWLGVPLYVQQLPWLVIGFIVPCVCFGGSMLKKIK